MSMHQDFTKTGYFAATINYRLGYFHTDVIENCNVLNRNCLTIIDSAEWIRSSYRGVQDAKCALCYLINLIT